MRDVEMLRPCRDSDAPALCGIYNYFVAETVVTFEVEPISARDMAKRVREVTATLPWLVWEEHGRVTGYAYAAPWHQRCAYRLSVESTIYLADGASGRGIGTRLYRALLDELTARGMHCVVAGIALPNGPSVALHEKLGFSKIGHFREVGRKFERWIDVGYWQLLLPA
jgi:L-amino acid N-acyltransferase YncA